MLKNASVGRTDAHPHGDPFRQVRAKVPLVLPQPLRRALTHHRTGAEPLFSCLGEVGGGRGTGREDRGAQVGAKL